MAILKYTTEVSAEKTCMEIQSMLAKAGADAIMLEYDSGIVSGITFRIATIGGPVSFTLPCENGRILGLLCKQRVAPKYRTKEQAARVGWRIIKHWIEAQLAFIETGQVTLDQAFLAYARTSNGQTVYERYVEAGMSGLMIEKQ